MMLRIPMTTLALIAASSLIVGTTAFQTSRYVPSVRTRLPSTTEDATESIPYEIARGDGSTGGGGLPMPHAEDDDNLVRPKVGAAMPDGRPSWFKVPAPSQGTLYDFWLA